MAMREVTYTRKEEAREYARMARASLEKQSIDNRRLFRKYKSESVELDKQGISATEQLKIFREKEYFEKNGVPIKKKEKAVDIPLYEANSSTVRKTKSLSLLQKVLLGFVLLVVLIKIT